MPKSILDIKNSIDCHLEIVLYFKANGGRKRQLNDQGF